MNEGKLNITSQASAALGGVLSDRQYLVLMEYYSETGTILSLLGVISNVVNIHTFIAMVTNDGVTVSFLFLSFFDLSYDVVAFGLGIAMGLDVLERKSSTRFPVDPFGMSVYLGNFLVLINVTNVLTTTFLAVVRCLCVARPLHFKNWFTKTKTVCIMMVIVVVSIVSYAPVIGNMGFRRQANQKLNITRLSLWVSSKKESIKIVTFVISGMILPVSTEVIVLVCVIVMANSLRAASKFRQTSVDLVNVSNTKQQDAADHSDKIDSGTSGTAERMSGKERRVVQQVVLISLVYIICNTPKVILVFVSAFVPQFAIGRQYSNMYLTVNIFKVQFEVFNSAVNTIIYIKYNTKFRKTLLRKM